MTAPIQGSSVNIDDVESQLAQETKPDITAIKLEGDAIPEDLRGKSVADLVAMQKALAESLKLSEHARLTAIQHPQQAAPPAPVAPPPEPDLTDEQLAELYQENPIAAMRKMQEQAARAQQRNLESRLGTLTQGTATVMENQARQKYKEEFAVLGSEISQVIRDLPDKSVLTDEQTWDKLIGYVRGLPGNFEKIIEAKTTRPALAAAQAAQDAAAGISFTPGNSNAGRGGFPQSVAQMDEYTKEIARNLSMTPEEYLQWAKIA